MAILVTRPAPDSETTVAALRSRGYEAVVSPVLRFEPVAFHDDGGDYAGVILTSANAARALAGHPALTRLMAQPVFTVGTRTAEAARRAGLRDVVAGKEDAAALRKLIAKTAAARKWQPGARLCYLAGAEIARDLGGELDALGFAVVTHVVYRMNAVPELTDAALAAFRDGRIEAVLHYSRRSARVFLDAARAAGVEIAALALPQCCISETVAAVLREAGAMQAVAAATPDEAALLDALGRIVKPLAR